jgi:hypothetical protein
MRQLYAYLLVGTISFSFGIQTALAEEQFKVVSSNVSQYKPNQTFKAGDKITLKEGQKIMLKHNGDKRWIKGPFSGILETFKELFGVGRGEIIDPWHVNVLEGENFCYFPSKPVMLERSTENAQQAMTLGLKERRANELFELNWPAKETKLEWPQALPIADGKRYKVKFGDKLTYITFHQLDEKLMSAKTNLALAMMDKGCKRQADLLTFVD